MHIALTGNPFVDTGLAVLALRSGCEDPEELTLEKMRKVHGDGSELASRNSKLKSTSMIFTINSLATHPGIRPSEKRVQFYAKITTAILNKIGFEDVHERCESCGNEYSLDIDKLIRETLVPLGYKDETRYTGRDWFPLAGSMGSDAQALPAGSRSPNLCAKCLFAVHYLPQGVMLREGRLTVFQSTSQSFWYSYVKGIAEDVERRILANIYETRGSKEGSGAVVERTLATMNKLRKLDPGTTLFIWMFSNSGTGPDCDIDEIPNTALQFLFEAITRGIQREDIMHLIKKDKSPPYSFLNCISKGTDYYRLYPSGKYEGVSPEFFLLYQTRIRGVSNRALRTALKIARHLRESFPDLRRFESFRKDLKSDFAKRSRIRKCIVEMVNNGKLGFLEYRALFAQDSNGHEGINNDAWKYISYYTYHADDWKIEDGDSDNEPAGSELLAYIGQRIFEDEITNKGKERFRKEVLNQLALGRISTHWLRRQFLKGARIHEGFNYNNWKVLFQNEKGIETTYEALFRLRLMWIEWLNRGNLPKIPTPPVMCEIRSETDIPSDLENTTRQIVRDYLERRGAARFQRDIINELITGRKDLYWFKDRLSKFDSIYSDPTYWGYFCTDQNGNPINRLRLFQLTLFLMNCFREQTFKANAA
jgi:CRISPR-associated protein Cst1